VSARRSSSLRLMSEWGLSDRMMTVAPAAVDCVWWAGVTEGEVSRGKGDEALMSDITAPISWCEFGESY
jgi:hypothetical protein